MRDHLKNRVFKCQYQNGKLFVFTIVKRTVGLWIESRSPIGYDQRKGEMTTIYVISYYMSLERINVFDPDDQRC
jgi:hypothetical protein